jgi:hypothetical protein
MDMVRVAQRAPSHPLDPWADVRWLAAAMSIGAPFGLFDHNRIFVDVPLPK